jgi:hypothetical protein
VEPGGSLSEPFHQVGEFGGWLAVLLASAAALACWGRKHAIHIGAAAGLMLGIVAACAAGHWDDGSWLGYHTLLVAWSTLCLGLVSARDSSGPEMAGPSTATQFWVVGIGTAVVILALRGTTSDPGRPYWSVPATLAVCVTMAALAWRVRRPEYLYPASLLVNVVGLLIWFRWGLESFGVTVWMDWPPGVIDSFCYTQILCLGIGASGSTLLERRLQPAQRELPPVDAVSNVLALLALATLVVRGVAAGLFSFDIPDLGPLPWLTLITVAVAVGLSLRHAASQEFGDPGLNLYVTGLLAIGLALGGMPLPLLGWAAALALAAYGVLTAVLSWRLNWRPRWFWPCQVLTGAAVVELSVWASFGLSTFGERLAGAVALMLLLSVAVIAAEQLRSSDPDGTDLGPPLRWLTLILTALVLAEIGWALTNPESLSHGLRGSAVLTIALTLAGTLCAHVMPRFLRSAAGWATTAWKSGPVFTAVACAVLLVFLTQEFTWYDPVARHTPLPLSAVLLTLATILLLVADVLSAAVRPGPDPLGLPERGRKLYVYAAEILLGIFLLHLRLNVDDFLPGFLVQHWTLVVMTVAFVGAAVSELLSRRGLSVLAEPLLNTGVFLPLLPLTAFLVRDWLEFRASLNAAGASVPGLQPLGRFLERLPETYATHALLWFLLGGLYAFVALAHRSRFFALLAALAANFGMWVIWAHHETLSFALHPQLWLIPLALIVLTAEHVNRDRLTSGQSAALRHLALSIIYAASTADMFIAGLGNSLVLPVVLAVLSVLGVLGGILLRVQAFLFQGLAFLVLDVFAQIWYAAVEREQPWVWWVSGILLGVAILALFAVFEKRRQEVISIVAEIKAWE